MAYFKVLSFDQNSQYTGGVSIPGPLQCQAVELSLDSKQLSAYLACVRTIKQSKSTSSRQTLSVGPTSERLSRETTTELGAVA